MNSKQNQHAEDLQHIRSMMERSSRFMSLSGISGVFAGSIALVTTYVAYKIMLSYGIDYFDGYRFTQIDNYNQLLFDLFVLGFVTLCVCIGIGIFFTMRKSKKNQLPIWTATTYNMIEAMMIPLVAGGIACLAFFSYRHIYYIAPTTLIFYGLALVSASKYTFGDVKYLGIFEVILGLVAFFMLGYGLLFWAIGFGVLHIVYGLIMHVKYK
ncbi:MAG: hypothetical protein C4K58_07350 [Flavobacteriaceae bacterium]|nr:MAG: hypothetical protein C4K58_07350 [Flavobacteriaceae bacterium]